MLESSDILSVSSLCLFSRFDCFQIEEIVGSTRINKLLNNENQSTYLFC